MGIGGHCQVRCSLTKLSFKFLMLSPIVFNQCAFKCPSFPYLEIYNYQLGAGLDTPELPVQSNEAKAGSSTGLWRLKQTSGGHTRLPNPALIDHLRMPASLESTGTDFRLLVSFMTENKGYIRPTLHVASWEGGVYVCFCSSLAKSSFPVFPFKYLNCPLFNSVPSSQF